MKNPARKKTLLPFLLVFITFISCKKSDNESNRDYYVSFKLNGTAIKHTNAGQYGSLRISPANSAEVIFQVVSRSDDSKHLLALTIQRNGAIGTQKYENVPSAGYFPVIADYMQDYTQPDEIDYTNQNAPSYPPNDFSITISKIHDDYLRGTFTGNYLYDNAADEIAVITEGEFFVRRTQ